MIKPHCSDTLKPLFVEDKNRRAALLKEARGLPSVLVSSAAAANAVMLGEGIAPPPDFSRPEVARILIDYYRGLEA